MRETLSATDEPPALRSMANSARHTVLRRLAPALKHDMVVNLQAVAMMAEMLNARIERGSVAAADLQSNISKLNRLAREAVASCLKVTSWIEASGDEAIELHQGVEECVRLLAASFNFRGFALSSEVAETGFEVRRDALRCLLAASLLALADTAAAACELVVEGEVEAGEALLTVRCRPRELPPGAPIPPASDAQPRPLVEWDEVRALAQAEAVALERGDGVVRMRLPRAVVTSPLQMAPV